MAETRLGDFVWYELMTTDPAAAKSYYQSLIGWGTQDMEGSDPPYTFWTTAEGPVGGLMELPDEAAQAGAPPHWMPYVSTPDVDQTVAKAKDLGASVLVEPRDIPEVGRFSVIADPQGAVITVFTPLQPADRPGDQPQNGHFSWHELMTTDLDAAFGFYSSLFGWQGTDKMDMGGGNFYQMYGNGGPPLGGMFNPGEMPGPPAWLLYVNVPDADAGGTKATELGGQVLNGPMDVPGGDRVVQCMDPQGAAFAMHAVGAPTEH